MMHYFEARGTALDCDYHEPEHAVLHNIYNLPLPLPLTRARTHSNFW